MSSKTLSTVVQLFCALLLGWQIVTLTSGKFRTDDADDTTTGIVLPIFAVEPPPAVVVSVVPGSDVLVVCVGGGEGWSGGGVSAGSRENEGSEPTLTEPVSSATEPVPMATAPWVSEPVLPEPLLPAPVEFVFPGLPDVFPFVVEPLFDAVDVLPADVLLVADDVLSAVPPSLPPPPQAASIRPRHNAEAREILRIMNSPLTGSDRS